MGCWVLSSNDELTEGSGEKEEWVSDCGMWNEDFGLMEYLDRDFISSANLCNLQFVFNSA